MANRPLVPLQPKPNTQVDDDDSPDPPPSKSRKGRSSVLVACEPCRRLKAKCDGERPSCRRCRSKGQECVYELPEDALSRSSARKEIANRLQRENSDLRSLLHDLSSRPDAEAYNIYRRLRLTDDPISLTHSIRQAELLLPTVMVDGDEFSTLQQLEANALDGSVIKVPAQPWTTVAGDGIVSELISAWFKWDGAFLCPFVDSECFLQDIRSADPRSATYCSPFLVNAICAYRSYFSDTVDAVRHVTKKDLREHFFTESLKHSASTIPILPTIQALWILFSISFLKGDDRNGGLYRFASYGMLSRSRICHFFPNLDGLNPEDNARKQTISKMIWGHFCLESIVTMNFRGTDVLQPPQVPCPFPENNHDSSNNLDIFGQPFTSASPQPPLVSGAIGILCRVAVLMSEILTFGQDHKSYGVIGTDGQGNLNKNIAFLMKLNEIDNSLPPSLRHHQNFTPSTCFLRIAMNTAMYAILRTLRKDVVLDQTSGMTVETMMLRSCELDIELMEQYLARWTTGEFSLMAFIGPLNAGTVLLPLIQDEAARQMFPRLCKLMHIISRRMPIAKYVLKGWEAALRSRDIEIPEAALPFFESLGIQREELTDISTSLVVTHIPRDESVLAKQWDDGELGFLLSKWNEMSLE
ncbi:putative C6 transcription factor [Xylaria bambusicola]|uniref:putative C6 transcription factor n=1 Tax=Xylaria bambusicola TaxID=326684 RepID=UPI002008E981|nr:putative C6 transcription factor [Xylaria bambusicola]KAI0516950.1 putative C6 transcription factor [Xylaria bambusicola]